MPIPCHMTITGEEQGLIEGSCEIDDREGTIQVQELSHTVELPMDKSGSFTGRRVHRPMVITKEIDMSSPRLFQAMCMGERLTEIIIDWYRIDPSGMQELYYIIKLENAIISKIETRLPHCLDRALENLRQVEVVAFNYEKITWTWEPDGLEYEDMWGSMMEK